MLPEHLTEQRLDADGGRPFVKLSIQLAPVFEPRQLSLADRVGYQRAIEGVYWRHRTWPKERPDRKPSLDEIMPAAKLEQKVEDYLRNSQALEDFWQEPVRAEQLQVEIERMAQDTKQPEVLRELFAALGNDPFIIAECLARQTLAERLVSDFSLHDERHKEKFESWRTKAEKRMPNVMAAAVANYTLPTIPASAPGSPEGASAPAYERAQLTNVDTGCTDDTWTATNLTNAPSARKGHNAVWTGAEMIVWGGYDSVGENGVTNTGGRYNPATNSWMATSTTNAPFGRWGAAAVWTGSEMIVWGGNYNHGVTRTGGRYNPATDSWIATSTTDAPSAREGATAVWTGAEMIVWGAGSIFGGTTLLNTGGRYNPAKNSWTATSTANVPSGRENHTAIWTGAEMIVWGGYDSVGGNSVTNTGGRYNPMTNSWTATSTANAPSARDHHTAVWTGAEMIVWGRSGDTGGKYSPATDSWIATSTTNAPPGGKGAAAVWTGSEMIVWIVGASGGRYNPATDSWIATSTTNAPSEGSGPVWTGAEMIVWGGGFFFLSNVGGRYCAQAGTAPAPTITSIAPNPVVGSTSQVLFTITGTNFVNGTKVQVGYTSNNYTWVNTTVNATYVNSTTLTVPIITLPVADIWHVRVMNPDGQPSPTHINLAVTVPGTPTPPPSAPTITSIAPNPVVGSTSQVLFTVTGTHFVNGTKVQVGYTGNNYMWVNTTVNATYVNSTTLTVPIITQPVADIWHVRIMNPDGQPSPTYVNLLVTTSGSPTPTPTPSGSPPPLLASVSVHAVPTNAIVVNSDDDVDALLTLRPSESLLRTTAPSILGGLVADGVTPLLIQIASSSLPLQPTTFQITATVTGGSLRTGTLTQNLHVLQHPTGSQSSFVLDSSVILSPAHRTGFAYIHGIKSEDIQLAGGSKELSVTLSVAQVGYEPTSTVHFSIRRPPIALIHGYHSSRDAWGADFLSQLRQTNASDFIIRVEYGVSRANGEVNNDENTYGTLTYLAGVLDSALRTQVELPLRQTWTFTRYDVVGHSQGGVLARMLCTKRQAYFATPFVSASNLYRGRFHRVITIGSPQNGSTFLYYIQQRRYRSGGLWVIPAALEVTGLLQPKFLPPFGIEGQAVQLDSINDPNGDWATDSAAKVHLIGTTIFGGNPPSVSRLANPPSYWLTGLCEPVIPFGPSRGLTVLPVGSDGIVDYRSELGWGAAPFDNISASLGVDIAHADCPAGPQLFDVGNGVFDTQYIGVAEDVRSLLIGPTELFGPFVVRPIPSYVRGDIDSVIPNSAGGGAISGDGVAVRSVRHTGARSVETVTYNFRLIPNATEPISGPPVWYAQVFGPNGITPLGVTVTVDNSNPNNVSVAVDPDTVGTVVLYANYVSQTGKVIVADPVIVVSRPPGSTVTGIELIPATVHLSVGSRIASELWEHFDNGARGRIYFPPGSSPQYLSSSPGVATVDAQGEILLQAAGNAVATASYAGFSAQSSITVLPDLPPPTSPTALGNISTRLEVGTGDNAMIGGFIITGSQPKRVIIRGIGPSLTSSGVAGALADPVLELHVPDTLVTITNANWRDAQETEIEATGLAPSNDQESAIVGTLAPGGYTAIVRGTNNGTGVGLVEVYDLDQTVPSKLANISTRGFVNTGDNVMIGGTIIIGNSPPRVLVRAIGPSLTSFGITNALPDPTLELRDGNGALMASNDNWRSDQEVEIMATGIPPSNDLESAVLATLPANNSAYTAIVRGRDNSIGVALVEAYQLDN